MNDGNGSEELTFGCDSGRTFRTALVRRSLAGWRTGSGRKVVALCALIRAITRKCSIGPPEVSLSFLIGRQGAMTRDDSGWPAPIGDTGIRQWLLAAAGSHEDCPKAQDRAR
jgi:hypothetical protein